LFLPPRRNINAQFIKDFLAGRKRLLKKEDVISVGKCWRLKGLTTSEILAAFPDPLAARAYFPDLPDSKKLDRKFTLNVN
jgi:hypothetical protein